MHVVSVAPGLAHSGLVSDRLHGVLRSRSFTIEARFVHFLACGNGGRISVVIDGFEKIRSPIYGGLTTVINSGSEPRWVTMDLQMWAGHSAYFEIADGAVVDFGGTTAQVDDGHGWIAVDEIRMSDQPSPAAPARPAGKSIAQTPFDLVAAIAALGQAQPALAGRLAAAVAEVDAVDRRIPDPLFAPSQADGTGMNEHVHIRGSHKNLGEVVPRRFLAVLGGSDSPTGEEGSHRDLLARRMVDPAVDPLLPRVLVNRLWKHHFGEGIVRSTDDFGAMGQMPSHPELLDWLACKLIESGWSLKAMHRMMLTSSTYRMSSLPEAASERIDPANTLLHRMNVRRLEAEAIRDSLLAVSGQLEPTDVRTERAGSLDEFHGRPRPACSIWPARRRRPAQHLSQRAAEFPEPDAARLRCAGAVLDHGPAECLERARPGSLPLERPAGDPRSPVLGQRAWRQSPPLPLAAGLTGFSSRRCGREPTEQEARASLDFLAGRKSGQVAPGDPNPQPGIDAWSRSVPCADQHERVYIYRLILNEARSLRASHFSRDFPCTAGDLSDRV